jgi:geranylgeranyl diphosphate synthase type 3/geranylgeranyl diphosphate synthase type I
LKIADESPHYETPLEWWFFQGFYESSHIQKKHFMLSLFRQKIKIDSQQKHVFYLINSLTDPKSHSFGFLSQIHQDVLDNLNETKQFLLLQDEAGNLDPFLFKAYMDEIKAYGPPSPIQVTTEPVCMNSNPLFIRWADFSLKQEKQAFVLSFKDPIHKNLIQMKLSSYEKVVHLNDYEIPNLETTFYNTYPRMNLSGKSDSEPIQGNAWMDHQWGDFNNWFFSKSDKKRYLGWNWIGVNLDDGSNLVITTHRDMEKNEVIDRGALYIQPGSTPQVLSSLTMEPTSFWESPQTHAIYPIEWKVSIPELEINFDFVPFLKEQEIPFFGVIRAVWEGAGVIRGYKKKKPLSGLARLELHGYAYLFNFKKYLQTFSQKVDETIESFFPKKMDDLKMKLYTGKSRWTNDPEALTSVLSKPVWDLISRKGRRWRPLFGLLALESLGVSPNPYKQLICSTMELNHTGALIIDDIEDQSLIRRGEKCIHLKYGDDISINAGCTLYFLPYLLVKNNPHLNESQKRKLHEIMNNIMIKAHFGQAMDIYWSNNLTIDNYKLWSHDSLEDKILQMYAYKTGDAVEGGSEAACVIAESSEKILQNFKSMAVAFGTAFQIIDDVHNFNSSSKWTKQTGEDISSGKLTFVINKAIQNLDKKDADQLLSILCSKQMRKNPKKLKNAVCLVKKSGSLSLCKKEATSMIEREWKNFSKVIPMTEAKIQIKLMITGLINFNYET